MPALEPPESPLSLCWVGSGVEVLLETVVGVADSLVGVMVAILRPAIVGNVTLGSKVQYELLCDGQDGVANVVGE